MLLFIWMMMVPLAIVRTVLVDCVVIALLLTTDSCSSN
jgi:hypothetical protein